MLSLFYYSDAPTNRTPEIRLPMCILKVLKVPFTDGWSPQASHLSQKEASFVTFKSAVYLKVVTANLS